LIVMFSSPPRSILMALVVGDVTHDPIKARRQLEQARAASAVTVAHLIVSNIVDIVVVVVVVAHCSHRPCRTPPSLSLPPPSPPSPPLPPPSPPLSPLPSSSLLLSLLPLPPQSPPPQPWIIVVFSSPPPAKSHIRRQAGNDEKRLVLVRVQTELIGEVAAMVVARIERNPE
jgi:hypothetical protein